jgi:preprotein translocase subunit SecD
MTIINLVFICWTCFSSAALNHNQKIFNQTNSSVTESFSTSQIDTNLVTGWYYISDSENEYKRNFIGTIEYHFIVPVPILTAKDFKKVKIYKNDYSHDLGVGIEFTEAGTEAWSAATEKSIGKKLAFILKNKLIFAPIINEEITGGFSSITGRNTSKKDLKKLKKEIEVEMK